MDIFIPISSHLPCNKDPNENDVPHLDGKVSDHPYFSEVKEAFGYQLGCNWEEDSRIHNAEMMFAKIPQSNSCMKIAPPVEVAPLYSIGEDCEHAQEEANKAHDASFINKQRIMAKLGTLDGPYLKDIVFLCANAGRFSTFRSIPFCCSQLPNEMPLNDDEVLDVNLSCLECQFFRPALGRQNYIPRITPGHKFEVTRSINVKCSYKLLDTMLLGSKYTTYSLLDAKIMYNADIMGYGFGSSGLLAATCYVQGNKLEGRICMVICRMRSKFQCFDPGIDGTNRVRFQTFTLEDKGVFRGEEDEVYETCIWELFDDKVSWCTCIFGRPLNSWMTLSVTIIMYKGVIYAEIAPTDMSPNMTKRMASIIGHDVKVPTIVCWVNFEFFIGSERRLSMNAATDYITPMSATSGDARVLFVFDPGGFSGVWNMMLIAKVLPRKFMKQNFRMIMRWLRVVALHFKTTTSQAITKETLELITFYDTLPGSIYNYGLAIVFIKWLLKHGLGVAIEWVRKVLIIYIFDPGGY